MFSFLVQKAYADTGIANTVGASSITFSQLLANVDSQIVTPLIYLLAFLAILYFFWGLVQFIRHADDADAQATGARHMLWGVIGLFIMFSAKALIYIILSTLGN